MDISNLCQRQKYNTTSFFTFINKTDPRQRWCSESPNGKTGSKQKGSNNLLFPFYVYFWINKFLQKLLIMYDSFLGSESIGKCPVSIRSMCFVFRFFDIFFWSEGENSRSSVVIMYNFGQVGIGAMQSSMYKWRDSAVKRAEIFSRCALFKSFPSVSCMTFFGGLVPKTRMINGNIQFLAPEKQEI